MCYNNILFRINITNTQGANHKRAVHISKFLLKKVEIASIRTTNLVNTYKRCPSQDQTDSEINNHDLLKESRFCLPQEQVKSLLSQTDKNVHESTKWI